MTRDLSLHARIVALLREARARNGMGGRPRTGGRHPEDVWFTKSRTPPNGERVREVRAESMGSGAAFSKRIAGSGLS
jgi:hypothetical protein